ncbi:MAG: hypothetical protein UV78_C0047G0004 [Parcubacteria group bacterium GW2011_GWA2_43_17]|nr:MAG: hypothetical protein UV78_C0047G0004 [Parcubacteria group bacterium GW2011_GWA2_43_17]
MSEPCKMFSVVLPFSVYEKLRAVARLNETSIGGLLREGANLLLRGKALDGQSKNTK